MGMAIHIKSDGPGYIHHGHDRLEPQQRVPLEGDCWCELRRFEMGRGSVPENWIIVFDEEGSRVGICVDRAGEYTVTTDRAYPVGGPDCAFR